MTQGVFDTLFESYWQDFCARLPVAGGMAFQDELSACRLDESLESLKRVDRLLLAIKQKVRDREEACLARADFRHFLLFVAAYAGRVLAKESKRSIRWQNMADRVADADFYTKIAAVDPSDRNFAPFFVVQAVGARLFGRFDRPFLRPFDRQSAPESVYLAVMACLQASKAPVLQPNPEPAPPSDLPSVLKPSPVPKDKPDGAPKPSLSAEPKPKPSGSFVAKAKPNTPNLRPTPKNGAHLAEVKADLATLAAANAGYTLRHDVYQKAAARLKAAQAQDKSGAKAALQTLGKLAKAGNSSAMLHLAVVYFEGVFVAANPEKGFALTKKAADAGDMRAQKFLSRLYYQGLGVATSTQMGEFWLARAAENGHPEAKKIQSQFDRIRLMQDDARAQATSDRRFGIAAAMVGAFFLAMIWLSAKFLV